MRPVHILNKVMQRHANAGKFVNQFLAGRGKDLPDWPRWCFLPMGGWFAIAQENSKLEDIATLSALGTWRYTQGIYRIQPDLLDALLDSGVFGNLPADVLLRLPEFCIYVDAPFDYDGRIHGFFAHLEWDINVERAELRLLLDMADDRLIPIPIHLGDWTVQESLDKMLAEAKKQAPEQALDAIENNQYKVLLAELATKLISVLLYICSEEPEIENDRSPGKSFYRPQPQKTRKGMRIFPADKPHVMDVGKDVGEKLRIQRSSNHTGRTVKTHIRRGHWHGYWTGPRDGERKFVYRWLPPMVVGGEKH